MQLSTLKLKLSHCLSYANKFVQFFNPNEILYRKTLKKKREADIQDFYVRTKRFTHIYIWIRHNTIKKWMLKEYYINRKITNLNKNLTQILIFEVLSRVTSEKKSAKNSDIHNIFDKN